MRVSWIAPETFEDARAQLRRGASSWEEQFDGDAARVGERPAGLAEAVGADAWPRFAEHVMRLERAREVVARAGLPAAVQRFRASPHAVERAALIDAGETGDLSTVIGVLDCAIDEYLAYGELLSRVVQEAAADPSATAAALERFVAAASAVNAAGLDWPERVRAARDGLAALYVRVGRVADAETLFAERLAEEPDATVAISAARAFLEAGETARAVTWLERGAARAREVGRESLEKQLTAKAASLRGRLN